MGRQLPKETFIPLFEAASLAAELSGTPEAIACEKVKIAVREAVVPMMVSTSADGPWRYPERDSEKPHPNYDIDVEASTYISQVLSCQYGEEQGEFASYILSPAELHVRLGWAAFLARHFPHISYLPATKPKGGRAPKHDWVAFEREAGRWIFQNGIPEPRSLLVAHMSNWCLRVWGHEPADSLIRERIKSILDYHNECSSAGN
jgi:hypothetical protein